MTAPRPVSLVWRRASTPRRHSFEQQTSFAPRGDISPGPTLGPLFLSHEKPTEFHLLGEAFSFWLFARAKNNTTTTPTRQNTPMRGPSTTKWIRGGWVALGCYVTEHHFSFHPSHRVLVLVVPLLLLVPTWQPNRRLAKEERDPVTLRCIFRYEGRRGRGGRESLSSEAVSAKGVERRQTRI